MILTDIIYNRLDHHKPNTEQANKIENLRRAYKVLVKHIAENCDCSRESSCAITKLEESMNWTIKDVILNSVQGNQVVQSQNF